MAGRGGAELVNLLADLPPEARTVLTLQLKPKWTKADHALLNSLTRSWTQVHRQVFEDRFAHLLMRAVRWE
jgi:hypothetical protein